MNGRVYDPEIDRFLSADPFVQNIGDLQSWNRYSYVLNNPLSFADPSGYFFKKLWNKISGAVSKGFKAIGSVVKSALSNPIVRGIIQVVGCAATAAAGMGPFGCAAVSAALTMAAGGSIADGAKTFAFAFVTAGIFHAVGPALNGLQGVGGALLKAGVHGTISGALSVAQGGTFVQGFAGGAIGALGGYAAGQSTLVGEYGDGDFGGMLGRAAISAGAGCAAAQVTGGKCSQAAVTAAFASLYNGDGADPIGAKLQAHVDDAVKRFDAMTGNSGYSPKQIDAMTEKPYLREMYRGSNIDAMVRATVAQDPELAHIRGLPNYGPDFIDDRTGKQYDMTTQKAFDAHRSSMAKT